MRRLTLVAFLVVTPSIALAQLAYPPDPDGGGSSYDGGSVTNPFLAPDGCTNPGYAFTNSPTLGICRVPDDASFVNKLEIHRAASVNGVAGRILGFSQQDALGTTRQFLRIYDPDRPSPTTAVLQLQSSSATLTTQFSIDNWNASGPAFNVTSSDPLAPFSPGWTEMNLGGSAFSALPGLAGVGGYASYCTDCQQTNPCTGGGGGAWAFLNNGVWQCGAGRTWDPLPSEPTCDATTRGQIAFVQGGAAVADTYRICAKNSSDTYAWYALATIP